MRILWLKAFEPQLAAAASDLYAAISLDKKRQIVVTHLPRSTLAKCVGVRAQIRAIISWLNG